MDKNTQYFFALLCSFLKDTTPPKANTVEWGKIYELARIHFVTGAVYVAIQKLNKESQPKEDILKKFKAAFSATVMRYEKQKKMLGEITKKLSEEKIPHIFLKGSVVKEYYPVKEMRTLGDIDLLLHKQDQPAAKNALVKIGHKNIFSPKSGGYWQYEKNNLRIDVHGTLMYDEINKKADYVSYFNTAWENATPTDKGSKYALNMEFHLIFLLAHIAKHFYGHGCGVRMIFDIAVIINKFKEEIDFTFLWSELKKIKLDIFSKNIFALCKKYFDVDISKAETGENFEIDDATFELFSKYIIEGGTFGFKNRNITSPIVRKEYEKTSNRKLAQTKALFGKIFLPYKEMKKEFPTLENFSFLLPCFWAVRGFLCITTRRKRTVRILKELTSEPLGAEESYEVMKKIGLV